MITLEVINIDSSFSLEDGSIQDFIVFRLPDGSISRALTDVETTKKIIGLATNGQSTSLPSEDPTGYPAPAAWPEPEPPEPPQTEGTAKLAWRMLSDEVLSPRMKGALSLLGVAENLGQADLQQLVEHIAENFTPEDWTNVDESMLPAAKPAPQRPPPAPPVNQVSWADGSPITAGATPARTVPSDDMGYPVVPGEVDTGEIVGGGEDEDEDGMSQF